MWYYSLLPPLARALICELLALLSLPTLSNQLDKMTGDVRRKIIRDTSCRTIPPKREKRHVDRKSLRDTTCRTGSVWEETEAADMNTTHRHTHTQTHTHTHETCIEVTKLIRSAFQPTFLFVSTIENVLNSLTHA